MSVLIVHSFLWFELLLSSNCLHQQHVEYFLDVRWLRLVALVTAKALTMSLA